MVDRRTNFSKEIIELLHANYGEYIHIFETAIPFSIRAAETSAEEMCIRDSYSRADVFKNLGFDTYTSKEYMDVTNTTANGWLKDEILVDQILDNLKSTARQDFIYTISVQGHGEYPTEKVLEDPAIKVTGAATEEKNNQWEYYVNQLHEMDQFVADLIDALDNFGEKRCV